jgi:hypothetical protein
VVDLAHRREGVVVLPVPDVLADPLDGRSVIGDELDGDSVPDVAAVGPWEILRGVHHLYLDRRRIEREVHRNPRCNLLHQPPAEDVIFEI